MWGNRVGGRRCRWRLAGLSGRGTEDLCVNSGRGWSGRLWNRSCRRVVRRAAQACEQMGCAVLGKEARRSALVKGCAGQRLSRGG
ncbi:hypothetical protein RchiOBHm_Chr5g0049241 [Rosa chinensis]|uniref:Uncharacterized protein n=1 Tax=Rosa chinensis TaxID=74649 RepID=A0A2P6QEX0_ROSCH|nr:hypothetical protein RchiOBHm_Chr5g0049241 [Rosa chinensis]